MGAAIITRLYDVITLEELIRARVPRPLDQVNLASGVVLAFGSDGTEGRSSCRASGLLRISGANCSASLGPEAISPACRREPLAVMTDPSFFPAKRPGPPMGIGRRWDWHWPALRLGPAATPGSRSSRYRWTRPAWSFDPSRRSPVPTSSMRPSSTTWSFRRTR